MANCETRMVKNASPTISKTSHPLHTGFSIGGEPTATATEAAGFELNGSGAAGVPGCSGFTGDCGSNCGLSEDDKPKFLQLRTDTGELEPGLLPAPAK